MHERDMHFTDAAEGPQEPKTLPVKIATIAMGLSALGLLSGRGTFAVVLGVGLLAMLLSPGRLELLWRFRRAAATPLVAMSGVVLLAWIPSTLLSYFPWVSIEVWVRMLLFVLWGLWVYAYFAGRPRELSVLLKTLFVGLAFGLLVANLGIWAFPGLMVLIKGHAASSSGDAALMVKASASAAIVQIPLVLWAGWRLGGAWRAVSSVLVPALLLLTVLAGSRAGMAGLIGAVGIALVALMTRRETLRWAAGLFIVLFVATIGIAFYLTDHSRAGVVPASVLTVPAWLIDAHRQVIWRYVLDLAAQRPWLGWGINTINLVPLLPGISPIEFGVPVLPSHPHNWVLEISAETGIVGGLPTICAVMLQFVIMLRRYRADGRPEMLAALSASAAFWISGLFNFSFWSAWWQVSYILVLALLYAATPPEKPHHVSGVDFGSRAGGESIGG